MGSVRILMNGSFPTNDSVEFHAEQGGHAIAISRAIRWLNDQLSVSIELDHKLHEQGKLPRSGFGL